VPEWLVRIGESTWEAVFMAAPWILFGLLVAGLLYVYLPANFVRKAMGGSSIGAVLRAALVGAPLPLCSCGVIPTALYLRKEGAGRGPVLSFLISTPETNVDSVALTYAMMGPVMAVARPVSAVLSAVMAGFGERIFGAPDPHAEMKGECGCQLCDARESDAGRSRGGLLGALKYAGIVLMRDLAPWLIVGLGLAGVIGGLVPENFFRDFFRGGGLGSRLVPMLVIILVATPMYMCATASTPVAAALVAKGVSPGAALVFLLVGPATNVATMTTVGRFLGKRSLAIYLASMVVTSLLLGLGLDYLAGDRISATVATLAKHQHGSPWLTGIMWAAAVLFLLLVANGIRLRLVPHFLAWRHRTDFAGASPATAATAAADSCCGAAAAAADPCRPSAAPVSDPCCESATGAPDCCSESVGAEAESCCASTPSGDDKSHKEETCGCHETEDPPPARPREAAEPEAGSDPSCPHCDAS